MTDSLKKCCECGKNFECDIYEIYGENEKFICEDCLEKSDSDYGTCYTCENQFKKIAYKKGVDLFYCENNDRDYCEKHYDDCGDDKISEDELDLIEKFSKD